MLDPLLMKHQFDPFAWSCAMSRLFRRTYDVPEVSHPCGAMTTAAPSATTSAWKSWFLSTDEPAVMVPDPSSPSTMNLLPVMLSVPAMNFPTPVFVIRPLAVNDPAPSLNTLTVPEMATPSLTLVAPLGTSMCSSPSVPSAEVIVPLPSSAET